MMMMLSWMCRVTKKDSLILEPRISKTLVKNPYIRAQTSGQLTASDPIRTTHENIAIYCGELPAANCLFFVKKTKDNRMWVADQEPVNMKRLEP